MYLVFFDFLFTLLCMMGFLIHKFHTKMPSFINYFLSKLFLFLFDFACQAFISTSLFIFYLHLFE